MFLPLYTVDSFSGELGCVVVLSALIFCMLGFSVSGTLAVAMLATDDYKGGARVVALIFKALLALSALYLLYCGLPCFGLSVLFFVYCGVFAASLYLGRRAGRDAFKRGYSRGANLRG